MSTFAPLMAWWDETEFWEEQSPDTWSSAAYHLWSYPHPEWGWMAEVEHEGEVLFQTPYPVACEDEARGIVQEWSLIQGYPVPTGGMTYTEFVLRRDEVTHQAMDLDLGQRSDWSAELAQNRRMRQARQEKPSYRICHSS